MSVTLLGPDGRPLPSNQKRALRDEIADAQITGLRNIWGHDSIASGLDPVRLADVLERAAQGDHHDFLTLAEEMEERDLHYGSVLGTRKRAIGSVEPTVEAASDDAFDVRLADEVRDIIAAPEFGDMVDDAGDALGKGYSANEIIWDSSAQQWWPSQYKWRDPRFFTLNQTNGHDLRLMTDDSPFGEALSPYKFIVHRPRLKSGIPIRGALGRLSAVAYMCKSFALSDWMTFAEVFGMPIRVGKYGANATPDEKDTLRAAVANIGSDAAAIIPESMKIEFEKAGATGGEDLFEKLCDWLDKQVSKGVLGQTASTEGTPGKLGGDDIQDEVRQDILKSDLRQLENTINRDLVRPYIDINHGPQKRYPRIRFPVIEPEDLVALTNALEKLVPLRLKVGMSTVRDKFGLPDPDPDEEVLTPPGSNATQPETANNRELALNRETPTADEIDSLADEMLQDWENQITPLVDPIQQLLLEAQDEEEFKARLPELVGQMDATELVKGLADAAFRARGLGDAQ